MLETYPQEEIDNAAQRLVGDLDRANDEPKYIAATSPEAKQLLHAVESAVPLNQQWDKSRAQVAAQLSGSWETAPTETVRGLLKSRKFVYARPVQKPEIVIVPEDRRQALEIPVDLILSASGFESWAGRNPKYQKEWKSPSGSGHAPSLEVIEHYASLAGDIPPARDVDMLVQPDGRVFFSMADGNHRTAAAMLRGDRTVPVYSIRVNRVERNYLDE